MLKKSTQELIKAKYPVPNPKRRHLVGEVAKEYHKARKQRAGVLKKSRFVLGREEVAKRVRKHSKTLSFRKLKKSLE